MTRHVNWNAVLDTPVNVVFSSLDLPDVRKPFERDVAQIDLKSGEVVDVSWIARSNVYVIVVYDRTSGQKRGPYEAATPQQVIAKVREIVDGPRPATVYANKQVCLLNPLTTNEDIHTIRPLGGVQLEGGVPFGNVRFADSMRYGQLVPHRTGLIYVSVTNTTAETFVCDAPVLNIEQRRPYQLV